MYHPSAGPSNQIPTRQYFASPMDTYTPPSSFSPATPTYPSYMQQQQQQQHRTSPYNINASSSLTQRPTTPVAPIQPQMISQPPSLHHQTGGILSGQHIVNVHEYGPQEGTQGTILSIQCDVLDDSLGYKPRNRAIRVVFGPHPVPTKVTVLSSGGKNEQFCHLTATVPSLSLSAPGQSHTQAVPVYVQVLDETHQIIDDVLLGQFHYVNSKNIPTRTFSPNPSNPLKRAGDTLDSGRPSPNSHRRMIPNENVYFTLEDSPFPFQNGFTQPAVTYPPAQPSLMRTTQLSPTLPTPNSYIAAGQKAKLEFEGDLMSMACGWNQDEWRHRRRLVQFWRRQDGTVIHAAFRPIPQEAYVPNSIVISCIYREDKNSCFVTSVDAIYLLEALVGSRFGVEEKNRIRRNLEGFRPITISKSKPGNEEFFKLIMNFPNPKPRNIEKDVKVFHWHNFGQALKKIINKYSASYSVGSMAAPPPVPPPQALPAFSYAPTPLQPAMSSMDKYDISAAGPPSSLPTNSSDSVPQLTSRSSGDSSSSFSGAQHTPSGSEFAPGGLGNINGVATGGSSDSPTHMMRSVTSSNSGGVKMEQYVNLSPPAYGPPSFTVGIPSTAVSGTVSGSIATPSGAGTKGLWQSGVDPFPSTHPLGPHHTQPHQQGIYDQSHQFPHMHQTVSRNPSSNDLRVMYPSM